MKFVMLEREDGREVSINPEHVNCVMPSKVVDGVALYFGAWDDEVLVKGTVAEVVGKLEGTYTDPEVVRLCKKLDDVREAWAETLRSNGALLIDRDRYRAALVEARRIVIDDSLSSLEANQCVETVIDAALGEGKA